MVTPSLHSQHVRGWWRNGLPSALKKSKDALKYMTKDAGEKSSRIPGWDREADAYFSCARRARQDVEGT